MSQSYDKWHRRKYAYCPLFSSNMQLWQMTNGKIPMFSCSVSCRYRGDNTLSIVNNVYPAMTYKNQYNYYIYIVFGLTIFFFVPVTSWANICTLCKCFTPWFKTKQLAFECKLWFKDLWLCASCKDYVQQLPLFPGKYYGQQLALVLCLLRVAYLFGVCVFLFCGKVMYMNM